MNLRYLLDTNICVHYLKGEFSMQARVQKAGLENCFLSEITIAELLFGAANSAPEWQTKQRRDVAELRAVFAGQVLPIRTALETFAEQKTHLRRLGRVVDNFDLLIGSTALAYGLTLVTHNGRHFVNMQGLILEDWVDDYSAAEQSDLAT